MEQKHFDHRKKDKLWTGLVFLLGLGLLLWRYWPAGPISGPVELWPVIYGCLLLGSLIWMAKRDIERLEIPNRILGLFLALGLGHLAWSWRQLPYYLLAAFLIGAFLFAVALATKGKLGGGDIKLMALAGLYLGMNVFLALFVGALITTLVGAYWVLTKKINSQTPIALGPFLGVGIYLTYLYSDWFWAWFWA